MWDNRPGQSKCSEHGRSTDAKPVKLCSTDRSASSIPGAGCRRNRVTGSGNELHIVGVECGHAALRMQIVDTVSQQDANLRLVVQPGASEGAAWPTLRAVACEQWQSDRCTAADCWCSCFAQMATACWSRRWWNSPGTRSGLRKRGWGNWDWRCLRWSDNHRSSWRHREPWPLRGAPRSSVQVGGKTSAHPPLALGTKIVPPYPPVVMKPFSRRSVMICW